MPDPVDDRAPILHRPHFYCPYCGVYAYQRWGEIRRGGASMPHFRASECQACGKPAIWLADQMIFPRTRVGPEPHDEMPEDVRALYEEARETSGVSRKSAAALLRLALQVLVDELEPGSGSINDKIGALVKGGLDPQVQQAMDVLRVIGNNAAHPGQINLDNDPELLGALFQLLNLVVEQVIARPKHVAKLFSALPEGAQAAVKKRDA